MIFYRGSSSENFKIESHINSRYGFRALFFTNDIFLAKLYARYRANEKGLKHGGFLYKAEIQSVDKIIDFNSEITHCAKFRNMIHQEFHNNNKTILIRDCYDYPSKEYFELIKSDVLTVFDLSQIKKIELIESNIT